MDEQKVQPIASHTTIIPYAVSISISFWFHFPLHQFLAKGIFPYGQFALLHFHWGETPPTFSVSSASGIPAVLAPTNPTTFVVRKAKTTHFLAPTKNNPTTFEWKQLFFTQTFSTALTPGTPPPHPESHEIWALPFPGATVMMENRHKQTIMLLEK